MDSFNGKDSIVIAILAKDKGFSLPFYLKCIYHQTYPKNFIHLYIRTNDNTDNTAEILHHFVNSYGHEYSSVYINDESISEKLKTFGHHEWNPTRFSILGKIRQDSVDHARTLCAHYFVVDCDNFIVPETIEKLMKHAHLGVIGPMLTSSTKYSNYHNMIDKNGYMKQNDLYYPILNRDIKGLIEVPVIHCTYLINNTFLKDVSYQDSSNRYEYVIFSDMLRKRNVKQYLDNRRVYGMIEFSDTEEKIDTQYQSVWRKMICDNFIPKQIKQRQFVMTEKKTLVIAPNAGFGNRMRTMVSAIYLADKLKMNIEHLWIGTPYTCALPHIQTIHDKSFEYYFKDSVPKCDYAKRSIGVYKVYTEWMPCTDPCAWYNYQSYGQKLIKPPVLCKLDEVNETMDASNDFLIETSYIPSLSITSAEKHRIYSTYFIPHERFLSKAYVYPKNMIGISIRSKIFYDYYPGSKINDSTIIKWLDSFDSHVLLLSDDKVYQKEMRQYLSYPVKPCFERRYNEDDAFLQFLLLSSCVKIYGTEKSSFAEEAAHFGGKEYIPLTKDFFKTF